MGPVPPIPSDVPAITGPFLDEVINGFPGCRKRLLSRLVPNEDATRLGAIHFLHRRIQGVWYAVSGVNIINGAEVLGEDKIETSAIITEETEVL